MLVRTNVGRSGIGSAAPPEPAGSNRLLACLPRVDRERMLNECEPVELKFDAILWEPGDRIRHVYFPLDAFISLIAPVDQNASLEVGLIGNEGLLGVARVLDIDECGLRAVVAGGGTAMKMTAAALDRELARNVLLHRQLNRYLYALMAQFAQGAACARYHDLVARLARWLLMTHDRASSNHFFFTHEFLASMLGVRRVGVTAAAGTLQRNELIRYHRGDIEILNRRGLELIACQCYRSIRQTYERFLGSGGSQRRP